VSDTAGTVTRVEPRPPGFVTDLVYECLPWLPKPYLLLEELVFDDGCILISVPAGFRCDLASVPKIAQAVVPKHELDYAGAVHDYLYDQAYDKDVADRLFYLIARSHEQTGRFRGRLAWRAVQIGGWPAWWKHWRERRT